MFMQKASHKTAVIVLVVAGFIGGTSVAWSYWSSTGGDGDDTVAAASASVDLDVNQTSVMTAMFPGDSAQTLSGTFDNGSGHSSYVTSVTVTIDSVSNAGTAGLGCSAADYTLAGGTMTVAANVPAGNGVGAWTGATIKFNNTGANQDDCQGSTVNLHYEVA